MKQFLTIFLHLLDSHKQSPAPSISVSGWRPTWAERFTGSGSGSGLTKYSNLKYYPNALRGLLGKHFKYWLL